VAREALLARTVHRIALATFKTRKETTVYDDLINLCEQYAATCAARVQALDHRGYENLGCTRREFEDMTGSCTRAASWYRYLVQALRRGDIRAYTMALDSATSPHGAAVRRDQEVTGEELPVTPRRRALNLPQ
jgi:hypothetical protein